MGYICEEIKLGASVHLGEKFYNIQVLFAPFEAPVNRQSVVGLVTKEPSLDSYRISYTGWS